MSGATIRDGVMPIRARRSRRRGDADARTSAGGAIRRGELLRPGAAAAGHEAVGDPALGEIVGGQFDEHLVADENADAVLAHLAGGMAEDLVIVLETHAKHRIGEQLDHLPTHFEEFFFRQAVSLSGSIARGP